MNLLLQNPARFQNDNLFVGIAVGHHDLAHVLHVAEDIPPMAAPDFIEPFLRGQFGWRFVAGGVQAKASK
jgi:hypothetical protein